MTRTARAGTRTMVRVLAFVAVLLMAVMALLLARDQTLRPESAADVGMASTPVPTIGPIASPVPVATSSIRPAALLEDLGILTMLDPSLGSPSTRRPAPSMIPGPLLDPNLSMLAGPRDVPLEIRIPSLGVRAPVMGVGLTTTNDMASPIGMSADDPIWQTAFWYRGGSIPGDAGTATLAGHYTDEEGRPGIFGYLSGLKAGELILIRDTRSGLDVPFIVTESELYTEQEAADPAVLARVFGSAAALGRDVRPVSDSLSRLTLVTCAGAWINGSFNQRFVVYAVRASYPVS